MSAAHPDQRDNVSQCYDRQPRPCWMSIGTQKLHARAWQLVQIRCQRVLKLDDMPMTTKIAELPITLIGRGALFETLSPSNAAASDHSRIEGLSLLKTWSHPETLANYAGST